MTKSMVAIIIVFLLATATPIMATSQFERDVFAKTFEKSLLLEGFDAYVKAEDKLLVIEWVGFTRPFIYQFANDQKTLDTLLKHGFLVIWFKNGLGDRWSVLTPTGEVEYFNFNGGDK